jgi:electron transfer flavoprotein alpha subunit
MTHPILVVTEQLQNELSEITYEMLGAGRILADSLKVPLAAVVMGGSAAAFVPRLGMADKVYTIEHAALNLPSPAAAAAVLQALLEKNPASMVLVAGTNVSLGIGAALAVRTNLPFINFCKAIKASGDAISFTSQLYGGKILCDVSLPGNQGIVSIYPGTFPASSGKKEGAPVGEKVDVPIPAAPIVFQRFIEPEKGDVDITKQTALIAVGRGIQSQDNIALAEDLAQELGGAVCASRPVIDQGWLPLSRQVGKSGMSVKPRLYVALGISGAPEHWEGMQGAQMIIAVNTDAKAPIFDGAHYGVCADALEIAPLLTDAIKARKG